MPLGDVVKSLFQRDDFKGRNDTYIDSALSGMAVFDVAGQFFNDHVRDFTNERLRRYKKNWEFYRGHHYTKTTEDGARRLVINYIKPVVNKSVDWLMNAGWEIKAPPGNEALAPLLEFIWMMNRKEVMSWELGQMGAVTGDAFIQVTVDQFDRQGVALPIQFQRIIIRSLNPAYVHPVYDPFDNTRMTGCLIQYPIRTNDVPRSQAGEVNNRPVSLYSMYITPIEIREYVNQTEIPGTRRLNVLGRIPIVHIKNLPLATGYYGYSDIDDIIPLNEEINYVAGSIGDIIGYHAAPTTLIFGARAHQLEKGANKVWSNLPVTARVENLQQEGELSAANEYLAFLKTTVHELSNTPENSLGKEQQISNTSNAALETQYMPLIEKTNRKRLTYGEGFCTVNELILQVLEKYFGYNLASLVGDRSLMYRTTTKWGSPLPQDMTLKLADLKTKVDNGWESQIGALRELGTKDPQRKAIEIMADQRFRLAEGVEAAVGATGERPPNLSVAALSSLAVGAGVTDAFSDQDKELAARQAEKEQLASDLGDLQGQVDEAQSTIQQAQSLQAQPPVAGPKKPPVGNKR